MFEMAIVEYLNWFFLSMLLDPFDGERDPDLIQAWQFERDLNLLNEHEMEDSGINDPEQDWIWIAHDTISSRDGVEYELE